MKLVAFLICLLFSIENLLSQSFADTVLYIEILKTNKNNFGRTGTVYKENGVLVEYVEKRYTFRDCNNVDFEFHSFKDTPVKTVTNRQLKKYSVITFPQLCTFLFSLTEDHKKQLKEKWIEMSGPPSNGIGHPQSPQEMYLFNLKKIYFVEKDLKAKRATITLVYYHNVYM